MSLSRGAKKSGSLGRKIKARLDRHQSLMNGYIAQGLAKDEASALAAKVIRTGKMDGAIVPLPKSTAIESLAKYNMELVLQLTILCGWLEKEAHKYCKCENNGDYCDFHWMLYDAKEALK